VREEAKAACAEAEGRAEASRANGVEEVRTISEQLQAARVEHAAAVAAERSRLEASLEAERATCAQRVARVQSQAEEDGARWADEMASARRRDAQLRQESLDAMAATASSLQLELDALKASCASDVSSRVAHLTSELTAEADHLRVELARTNEELKALKARFDEQLKLEALAMLGSAHKLSKGLKHTSASHAGHANASAHPTPRHPTPAAVSGGSPVDAALDPSDASGAHARVVVTSDAVGGFLPPRLGGSGSRAPTASGLGAKAAYGAVDKAPSQPASFLPALRR